MTLCKTKIQWKEVYGKLEFVYRFISNCKCPLNNKSYHFSSRIREHSKLTGAERGFRWISWFLQSFGLIGEKVENQWHKTHWPHFCAKCRGWKKWTFMSLSSKLRWRSLQRVHGSTWAMRRVAKISQDLEDIRVFDRAGKFFGFLTNWSICYFFCSALWNLNKWVFSFDF